MCDNVCYQMSWMYFGDLFAAVQLVELSAANSSETTSLQLQSSMAAVTQFVQGCTRLIFCTCLT